MYPERFREGNSASVAYVVHTSAPTSVSSAPSATGLGVTASALVGIAASTPSLACLRRLLASAWSVDTHRASGVTGGRQKCLCASVLSRCPS